jgi:hypothetical protein
METEKIVPVRAELFDRIEEEAELEGRSTDDLVETALTRYLATARLQRLQRYGASRAQQLGLKESDVPRLIEEYRNDQRSR